MPGVLALLAFATVWSDSLVRFLQGLFHLKESFAEFADVVNSDLAESFHYRNQVGSRIVHISVGNRMMSRSWQTEHPQKKASMSRQGGGRSDHGLGERSGEK